MAGAPQHEYPKRDFRFWMAILCLSIASFLVSLDLVGGLFDPMYCWLMVHGLVRNHHGTANDCQRLAWGGVRVGW